VIKKQIKKMRKDNKTQSKKAKRDGKKTWQKDNKRERTEDQVSGT
jgi:hypothetical protein